MGYRIDTSDFQDFVNNELEDMGPSYIDRVIYFTLRLTAEDLAEEISKNAPESDPDEYERSGDPSPQERGMKKLKNTFEWRAIKGRKNAFEVFSDDFRALLLEEGEENKQPSTPKNKKVLKFEDQNGNTIYRGITIRSAIEPREYAGPTVLEFLNSGKIDKNFEEALKLA